jgi:hypothetical protein
MLDSIWVIFCDIRIYCVLGVLNSASVVAQTITEQLSALILKYRNQNVAWGIAFGGVLSLIGKILSKFGNQLTLQPVFVFSSSNLQRKLKKEKMSHSFLQKKLIS